MIKERITKKQNDYIGPTRGNSEKESTVNCHDERRIVLMSVSLAILAVLIAIGAITSAVDQVSSMRRELSEIGDIAAAGRLSDATLGKKLEEVSLQLLNVSDEFDNVRMKSSSMNQKIQLYVELTKGKIADTSLKVLQLEQEIGNTSQTSIAIRDKLVKLRSKIREYHRTCPDPYVLNPTSLTCLRVSQSPEGWEDAKESCEHSGERLAIFELLPSLKLYNQLRQIADAAPWKIRSIAFWIGLKGDWRDWRWQCINASLVSTSDPIWQGEGKKPDRECGLLRDSPVRIQGSPCYNDNYPLCEML